MSIVSLRARQILNALGYPVIEVDLESTNGTTVRAAAASGSSKTNFEPNGKPYDVDGQNGYHENDVSMTIAYVNTVVASALMKEKDLDLTDQKGVDHHLVSLFESKESGHFSSNALLSASMAVCRAGAAQKNVPLYKHINDLAGGPEMTLPIPAMNMLKCGSINELTVLPTGGKSFSEALKMGSEIYYVLKNILQTRFSPAATNVGDQGEFVLPTGLLTAEDGLTLIEQAIGLAGYTGNVVMGMDVVASDLFVAGTYFLDRPSDEIGHDGVVTGSLSSTELGQLYEKWVHRFSLVSIEDPFHHNDWGAWSKFSVSNPKIQIVGDDLLGMNKERMSLTKEGGACNAILLKKMRTISDTIEVVQLAQKFGWRPVVTHRSGETEDTFISDLAVGLACGQIKAGAPCRSERVGKYNQLLRIEEELGIAATFVGTRVQRPTEMAETVN